MSNQQQPAQVQEFSPASVRQIEQHHELYRRDPAQAHLWDPIVIGVPGGPVPCLLLHFVGRKSGHKLDAILQYYERDGQVAIVASKGGMPNDPVWYLNLLANPQCEVQIGLQRYPARARTVTGEERARWWTQITREQPIQLEYQTRTSRCIPVVVLEKLGIE